MTKKSSSKATPFHVCGTSLLQRMEELEWNESRLASKAQVSTQTVRNYLLSTPSHPRKVSPKALERVCSAIGLEPTKLRLETEGNEPVCHPFLADPKKLRCIAGVWNATSEDLEIPGFLSYKEKIPWHGQLVITQTGNRFQAVGIDKDNDGIIVRGTLFENGNWLCFEYWVNNKRLREYGTALAEHDGDGKTIEGLFVGRDAGHSNRGIVVSKITLQRVDDSQPQAS